MAAERLEKRLTDAITAIVPQAVQACDPLEHIECVTLIEKQILLGINLDDFDGACVGAEGSDKNLIFVRAMAVDPRARIEGDVLWLTIDQPHLRRGRPTRSLAAGASEQERAANLAEMLRRAYCRLNEINANPASPENHHQMRAPQGPWARQAIILGLLFPDIQKAILAGNVPDHVTSEWLMAQDWPVDWPLDWEEQRQLFGSGCR